MKPTIKDIDLVLKNDNSICYAIVEQIYPNFEESMSFFDFYTLFKTVFFDKNNTSNSVFKQKLIEILSLHKLINSEKYLKETKRLEEKIKEYTKLTTELDISHRECWDVYRDLINVRNQIELLISSTDVKNATDLFYDVLTKLEKGKLNKLSTDQTKTVNILNKFFDVDIKKEGIILKKWKASKNKNTIDKLLSDLRYLNSDSNGFRLKYYNKSLRLAILEYIYNTDKFERMFELEHELKIKENELEIEQRAIKTHIERFFNY
jgi:hypothetical protein